MRAIVLCVIALLSGAAAAAALAPGEAETLFAEANEAFREGNDAVDANPALARASYERASVRLERLVRDGGIENGKLYYNLGNVYFRLGDLGRAILNLRRAESLRPFDSNVRQNLRYVRGRTPDQLGAVGPNAVAQVLFFWHYGLTPRWRQILFGIFWLTGWALVFVRFLSGGRTRWPGAVPCFVLSALLGASLAWSALGAEGIGDGVVVQEQVVARKGDGEAYQPAFSEPLHAGTEFRAREMRGEWVRAELADGRECWLRKSAIGFVADGQS